MFKVRFRYFPNLTHSLLERFRNSIHCMEQLIHNSNFLVQSSKVLGVPCVVTEEYPKGLLHTCEEIDILDTKLFEKTKFAATTPEFINHVEDLGGRRQAVVFGIEAHVCVQQTVLDLLERGWDVHVVADAVSSSRSIHRAVALDRMRTSGAFITTAESVVFELMRDTSHPEFKTVSNMIKENNQRLGCCLSFL